MKVGIVGNTQKASVYYVILEFVRLLKKYSIQACFSQELEAHLGHQQDFVYIPNNKMGEECDFVITFGGDGTMLSTIKDLGKSKTPILGVNMGGLGFLAEIVVEEMNAAIESLVNNDYSITERMMLEGTVHTADHVETNYALNDFIVDKGMSARLLYIETKVDNVLLNHYRADGVIVSTPTGSTAYSLSAGGPILVPNTEAIVVTPICPHSLTVRPIVLSDKSVLKLCVSPYQAPAQLHFDGRGKRNLLQGEWVEIKKADFTVNWVSIGKHDFYEIIRSKLNWGVDLPSFNKQNEPRANA